MTTRSWSSGSWYRVSAFRPRLRGHASIYRHRYRGEIWYVLQDRASGRFHRFTPDAHRLIAMMDGKRTLEEIWEDACTHLRIDAVTQEELVRLVGQLYTADVLQGDVPSDIAELSERGRRFRRQKVVRSVLNPLALRVPLMDPDDFLSATMPLVRPLFSWFGVLLFFGVVIYGAVLVALNWDPLTENVVDRVLATENLILILLAYPAVKALHELGHAWTIKRWGGSVHEIGVMFLVFMPVPYVDASDSIAFREKWRRALVGAAGILVEIFLAALAMIVWAGAEDGIVRAFAFNVMLIGGVSTLLFNGNPLLRFDGYYVLCDVLEIPNLGQRANKYIGYLVQRYGFGMKWVESPANAPGERGWFVFYGLAAFIYRLFITFSIVTLVASRFFVIGVILATWAVFLMLVLPVLKMIWFLFTSPALRRQRGRALAVTGGGLALVLGLLMAVPLPHSTLVEGIVQPEADAIVNATSEGIVAELIVEPGDRVEANAPIVRLEDPLIEARRAVLEARIVEIERRLAAESVFDRTAARILEEELAAARADLALTETRIAELTLTARRDGIVILPNASDLPGSFVRRGQGIAVVAGFTDPLVRVVVPETRADLVRADTQALELRFASRPERVWTARIDRVFPTLTRQLPTLALSTEGGGRIALDPASPQGRPQAFEGFYQLDLRLEDPVAVGTYGDRVLVRFAHSDSPLVLRLYRGATQVFLKYFANGKA
ncbi:efflux RND transporter periplasmic adaptor subunit [Tropicimonas sp. TH_r6]|uniref:efflux RND transporter periplasmic adaptor subunit n=1 Tax=Tropicimonas sp. TH_r6 TaxID=3082085 RepID=UPI00295540DD|nr:efflux RND transporter periplasmic adaptor subunit [Tropicimonas sp. TH_r6]MDV7141582.1 efflux RND transporter periplasmic adaptor subunit [Tropicimonas sp. TH_r6]